MPRIILRAMDPHLEYRDALAALAWQVELGADEAILDAPVNRYDAPAPKPPLSKPPPNKSPLSAVPLPDAPPLPLAAQPSVDPIEAARAAAQVGSLPELAQALEGFEHCALKKGARSCVFADGNPSARVMVIGEAPGRDEDIQGKPFVGRAGQLLDRMFGAIGLARDADGADEALYITNILPWRPPQNRDPKPDEIAMMLPFIGRHVALADPQLIVLMGNISCQAMLGRRGITRLRGHWQLIANRPAMPMFHPAYLLRNPAAKREAWADLLSVQARLREIS
jgi:DNA polymerase